MRRPALVAAIVTLGLCLTAPPASADVGGTLCSLAGWFSGVAGKLCGVARNAGGVTRPRAAGPAAPTGPPGSSGPPTA